MKTENAVFGSRIRSVREKQKLSREKLAELANISTQFLADIETGKNLKAKISIGVLWGFRKRDELERAGADAIVSHPREIVSEILNVK